MNDSDRLKVALAIIEHACEQLDSMMRDEGYQDSLAARRIRETTRALVDADELDKFLNHQTLRECQGGRMLCKAIADAISGVIDD